MKQIGLVLLAAMALRAADFPEAEITSRFLKVKLYTPDEKRGYYRASRFDWSGVVKSLTYQGHEFFGVWFPRYDPLLNDSITGPVEEFRDDNQPPGYSDAKVGGMFLKVGVGVLRKPDDEPYKFGRPYQIVNAGVRVVRPHADHVDFEHTVSDGEGYGYVYKKTLRLSGKKPQLILEHALKNTGKRTIDTSVYDHDFYMIDGQPTGPEIRVRFAFPPKATADLKGMAEIKGNELVYKREVDAGQSVASPITGFGDSAASNDFRVENLKTGAGVRETGDRPLSKL